MNEMAVTARTHNVPPQQEKSLDGPNCDRRIRFPEPGESLTIPFALFDSELVDSSFAYDAWRENMSVFFNVLPPDRGMPRTQVAGRIGTADMGEALLALTEATSQHFVRDDQIIVREEMDLILIQLFLRGGGRIPGQERIVAGDMLIIDLTQPHQMLNDDFVNLTLAIHKSISPELARILEQLHGRRIRGDNPLVQFMRDHLENFWHRMPLLTPRQGAIAVQGTLGLLGGWLGNDPAIQEQFQEPTGQAIRPVISRYIDAHLARPISVDELTSTFRLSRAQLYRIFQPYGGVATFIWERRLQRSLRILFSPSAKGMTLSSIAFDCGFNSESHFNNRFRSRFGMTPGQARGNALEIHVEANNGQPSADDDWIHVRRMIEGFVAPLETP
jgi:AraC-like DNA-binding protein